MDINVDLMHWFKNFLIKNLLVFCSGSAIKSEIRSNQQLQGELHKPIIRKFRKRKGFSSLKDKI